MRFRVAAVRWRRTLVVLAALLITGPLTVAEAVHVMRWGHLGLGLHTDLVSREGISVIGTPGGTTWYSLWGVNLTPLPLLLRACTFPSDIGPQPGYRYSVEKWTSEDRRWTPVMWTNADCYGEFIHADWKVLWPGASVELVGQQCPADRADWRFRNGDRFRFIVLTLFDRPDDSWLQIRVVSQEQVVTRAPDYR